MTSVVITVFFTVAIVLVAAYFAVQLIVTLQTLWLLIFGAIVVAVILRALADPIVRWLKAPDPLAVFLSLLIVVAVLAGVLTLFGTQITEQVVALSAVVPAGWNQVQSWIQAQPYAAQLFDQIQGLGDRAGQALQVAQRFAMGFASGVTTLVLVVVAGVFLAIEPAKSREGMLSIFPLDRRPRLRQVLNTCGMALKGWLKAQLFSMVLVGTLTGVGLAVIGVPSASGSPDFHYDPAGYNLYEIDGEPGAWRCTMVLRGWDRKDGRITELRRQPLMG